MANSKRKGTQGKPRRGALGRRGRHQEAIAQENRRKAEAKPSGPEGKDNGEPVSPLLETTGKASEEVRQEVKQLLEAAGDASKKIREAARTGASGGEERVEGNEPAALISKINSEVRTVLEAADEAAEKIRDEARSDARRLIDEKRRRAESVTGEHMQRVSEMTEEVLSELSNVQGQLETLRRAFDHSIKRLGIDLGVEGSDVWATKRNGAEDDDDDDGLERRLSRRPRQKGAEEPEGISEGARLLALQQHMAGVDADVIEKRLSEEFGIEDPRPVLEWMGIQNRQSEPTANPKKRR